MKVLVTQPPEALYLRKMMLSASKVQLSIPAERKRRTCLCRSVMTVNRDLRGRCRFGCRTVFLKLESHQDLAIAPLLSFCGALVHFY